MKKIILLSMLGMIFFTEMSFATEMKAIPNAPTGVWIKLLINLHRPKLNCERGFGICFIVSWGFENDKGSSEKNLCVVRGQLNGQSQLVIEIDEAALNKYESGIALPYFKDKTSITILDPYIIPESTCRALGSTTLLTIKPGNYPVTSRNGVYTIVF